MGLCRSKQQSGAHGLTRANRRFCWHKWPPGSTVSSPLRWPVKAYVLLPRSPILINDAPPLAVTEGPP